MTTIQGNTYQAFTQRLDDLRTVDFSSLKPAELETVSNELSGMRDAVKGIFKKTQAEVQQLTNAIEAETTRYNATALVGRHPGLEQSYNDRSEGLVADKADAEARLRSQDQLGLRIKAAMESIPGGVPDAKFCSIRNAIIGAAGIIALASVYAMKTYMSTVAP